MPPRDAGSPSTARQGLPRARRIRKRADFVRIQGGQVRVTTQHLLFLLAPQVTIPRAVPGEGAPPARLGVVASRKVGPAVTRNRAKRLVREVFRRSSAIFPAGFDVVVIVRPSPRWGPGRPSPDGKAGGEGTAPPLLGLAELAAEAAGAAPALARRARALCERRER